MAPPPAGNTASTARSFEIHRKSGDRWTVDSIADDKQIAIRMANALLKSGRARSGVKVISVQQVSDGEFREVQVYQATPEPQAKTATDPSAPPAAPKPKIKIERAKPEPRQAAAAKLRDATKKPGRGSLGWPVWAGLAAAFLLMAGVAALYGMQQDAKPWVFDTKDAQTTVKTPNTLQSQYKTIFDH